MTNRRVSDLLETIEVIQGRRGEIEGQKTWLRHGAKTQAGKIDLILLKGASISEIARQACCREQRVRDHFYHLQDGPSTMEPHRLRLIDTNDIWSFDIQWLEEQALEEQARRLE